jgi:predicted SnoaL-like aldol condensation-catalyzing enzyme
MSHQITPGAGPATQEVLAHHLEFLGKLDLDGTMADYADEATFISQGGVLHGSGAIRQFFGSLFEEFQKPGMSFDLLQQEVDGDTAYIVWTAESADNVFEIGTDTFIVQNGKIVTQTFAGKILPKR